MRKIAYVLLAGIAAGSVAACATDNTPKVMLTGPQIENLLTGNTTEMSFTVGPGIPITSWGYRKPGGDMLVMNSKGETGTAKWSVEGNKLCTKWVKPYHEWRVQDACGGVIKISETTYELEESGRRISVMPGNAKNLK